MNFAIVSVAACLLMGLICFLGTGNDNKNINNFKNFSSELQNLLREDEDFKDKIKKENPVISFISNLVLFTIVFFLLGMFINKKGDFVYNFLAILILGQIVNLFDFVIMDLLWFRLSKRVRLSKYQESKYYGVIKGHLLSYLKAIVMFTLVALLDGGLLMTFQFIY